MQLSVAFICIKTFGNPKKMRYYNVFMEWEMCTMFLPLKRHRENGLLIGMVAVPPNFRGAPKKTKIIGTDLSKKLNLGGGS